MLLIDQFKHIKNRADFLVALEDAIQRTQDLMKPGPSGPAEGSILRQLACHPAVDGQRSATDEGGTMEAEHPGAVGSRI